MSSSREAPMEEWRLTADPRSDVWSKWQGAVLLRDEIEYYANLNPPLINPFERDLLKPASYHLCVGSHCRVDGEDKWLSEQDPQLTIPPHASATISTFEEVNIPGFLVGRWNLKVKKVYAGLVWTGGPQVDPGYSGKLFCPIFNFSTSPIKLQFKEPLFTIDFVRTTLFDETRGCELLDIDRDTHSLGAVDTGRLKSGVRDDVVEIKASTSKIGSRLDRFQGTVFFVLAIVVSTVAILASLRFFGEVESVGWLGWASFAISMLAMVVSFVAVGFWWTSRRSKSDRESRD